jgi:hypothetical protein
VARFFDIRAVLNYRNGVEWLDINPLLWSAIDQFGAVADESTEPTRTESGTPAAA